MHIFGHPVPLRGRRPSSRTLDGLRWTLVYASTTAWISVRQNRVVLAPVAGVKLPEKRKRERRRRSQPRTRLRGDHGISRKAIAQGRPGVLRCPVCSCALCFVQTAHETAGAARTRSSLRPLMRGREVSGKARAQCVARSRSHIPLSSPGLTGRPSIPETLMIELRSRGVLGPPLSRRTTAMYGAAPSCDHAHIRSRAGLPD